MSKKLTFQEIILTLQQYWNDQGCMLMQAYDNEKGALPDRLSSWNGNLLQ